MTIGERILFLTFLQSHKNHSNCRTKLHAGIIRDVKQQEQRKFENMYILEQQQELTKQLKQREQIESQKLQKI